MLDSDIPDCPNTIDFRAVPHSFSAHDEGLVTWDVLFPDELDSIQPLVASVTRNTYIAVD